MNIKEITIKFTTDEQCLEYIEKMRWPDGIVRCPMCGTKEVSRYERQASHRKTRSKTRDPHKMNRRHYFYICNEPSCRHQFSPTSGTLFHDTHLPLITWFHAIALLLNAKKGISARQLQRDLGIGGYKTAWYLNHRIREAMREGALPMLGGIVEIDETYIGGHVKRPEHKMKNKHIVIGLRERKGPVRYISVKDCTAETWRNILSHNISPDVELIMTDDSSAARAALKTEPRHRTINHSIGRYVNGVIHTNSVESAFSLLKRGVIGQFHRLSIKHIQKYLNEFSYRFNRRNNPDAFIETVRRLCGFPPLTFETLTADVPEPEVPF